MSTLRDIRKKIHAVDNIQQITQAMEMVAASHLRKAQAKKEALEPYAEKIEEIFQILIRNKDLEHPLLQPREIKKIGLVIIAGDRGLCGGYNQALFNAAEKFLHKYDKFPLSVIPIGSKAVSFFETKKWPITLKLEKWGGKITYSQVEDVTKKIMNFYLEGELDEIWILYAHFINMNMRDIRREKFLKIDRPPSLSHAETFLFEPDPQTMLNELMPLYCTTKLQRALNEAYVSELAARVSSMRTATKNAEEMIEKLTLVRNKVRQAGITREIIEIVSGAEGVQNYG